MTKRLSIHPTSLVRGLALAAAALTVSVALPAGAAPTTISASTWVARASASYAAMQQYLFLGSAGHGLYHESYPVQPNDPAYAYLWTTREATGATVALANAKGVSGMQDDVAARFAAFPLYWTDSDLAGYPGFESYVVPPLGGGGDLFYDDNAVVGLEMARGYALTHDSTLLQSARRAWAAVARGWDADTTHACAGGELWYDSPNNTFRAANVTGLGAELAVRLYLITHESDYLAWGTRLFDWNQRCLQAGPGMYWNDMSYDGTVNQTFWSYNSGAMIGAATLLYRATGTASYLTDATAEADGALQYWTADDRLFNQPAIFNSFFFNNLLLLDSVQHDARYLQVMSSYAQREWYSNRDPQTGLFHFQASGGGPYNPSGPAQTLEQSAMVQMFSALAWRPSQYGVIT